MWLSTSACAQGQQHQQSAREQARAQQQSLVKVCCSCSVGCTVYIDYALLVAACWVKHSISAWRAGSDAQLHAACCLKPVGTNQTCTSWY